jgi:hypothetical protein
MAMYVGSRCILDTDLLISLEMGDGCQEHDGIYIIKAIFALGHKWREAVYAYTDKDDRDTDFTRIGALVTSEQEALELELSEDCEGDESDEEEMW